MHKILFVLSTVGQLSLGNRLLLQGGTPVTLPEVVPVIIVDPVVELPVIELPGPGQPGYIPAVPVGPTVPVAPLPMIPIPGGIGGGPPVTPLSIECTIACVAGEATCASPCALRQNVVGGLQNAYNIINAPNNFNMDFKESLTGAASEFNFLWGADGNTVMIEGIIMSAPNCVFGSKFLFENRQNGIQPDIKNGIDCGNGNCAGASFTMDNMGGYEILCSEAKGGSLGCGIGCTIQEMEYQKVIMAPVSCDLVAST